MDTGLILDWNKIDPHTFYSKYQSEHPVYYVSAQQGWNIYSYAYAKQVLLHQDALIPEIKTSHTGLNQNSVRLIRQLARLNNSQQHEKSRRAAMHIYNQMCPAPVNPILESLLKPAKTRGNINWVDAIAKKLPVLYILKSLNFGEEDCAFVVKHIAELVKIMSAQKTAKEIILLNKITDALFTLSQKHLANTPTVINGTDSDEWIELLTSNLIGLLIQSYDAGRGLLTNTLIQLIRNNQPVPKAGAEDYFRKVIIETLRFDPPVHLTRRIAGKDLLIGNQIIKEGEMITIVLAAANLDPLIFKSPLTYNPSRANNHEHLTFGAGHHQCLAKNL
ncbi:cytochrome P450 [Pedobacter sp. NJ-S-72]